MNKISVNMPVIFSQLIISFLCHKILANAQYNVLEPKLMYQIVFSV